MGQTPTTKPLPSIGESPFTHSTTFQLSDGRVIKQMMTDPDPKTGMSNVVYMEKNQQISPPAGLDFNSVKGVTDLKHNTLVGKILNKYDLSNNAPGATTTTQTPLSPIEGNSPYKITNYELSDGRTIQKWTSEPDATNHYQQFFTDKDGNLIAQPKGLEFNDKNVIQLSNNKPVGKIIGTPETSTASQPVQTPQDSSSLPTMPGDSPYKVTPYELSDGRVIQKWTSEPDATNHYQQFFTDKDGNRIEQPKGLDFNDKGVTRLSDNKPVGKITSSVTGATSSSTPSSGTSNLTIGENGQIYQIKDGARAPVYNGKKPATASLAADGSPYIPRDLLGAQVPTSPIEIDPTSGMAKQWIGVDPVTNMNQYAPVMGANGKPLHGTWDKDGNVILDGPIASDGSNGGGKITKNQMGPNGKRIGPIEISKGTAIMGVASLGLFAYGAFQAFRGSDSAGKAFGAMIPGLLGIYTQTRPLFQSLDATWKHADLTTVLVVAGIMLLMYGLAKWMPKEDKTLPPGTGPTNTSSPTAGNTSTTSQTSGTAPRAWFDWLPQNAIFYILPTVAVMAIGAGGLNLDSKSSKFWLDSRVKIQQSELPATVKTLKGYVTEPGKVTEDLIGKVFIKKGDAVNTPDMAVFVTRDTDGKLNFNKVSLSRQGYLVSRFNPKINNMPFFISTEKTVSQNPEAFEAVQIELSEAEAANSGIHPESAAIAAQLAATANKGK